MHAPGGAELGEDVDEQAVFGGVDALGQGGEGVVGLDRHDGGAEHRTVVDAFVGDEVDHHAGRTCARRAALLPRPGDGVDSRAARLAAPGAG